MGYLPTNKQIKEEVSNYDELTFFKKIKNMCQKKTRNNLYTKY